MAAVLVPMEIDGVTLLVEATRTAGSERTSKIDKAQEAVTDSFDRARAAIVAVAAHTVGTIKQLDARPDSVEVTFGLKFSAEGGVILAGASAEASLEVTLVYDRPADVV
ncbi:MAG: hypothetical protein JO100_04435 [Pseudonocardia sp.]|nr:hypothetical protein [Pseudonocardia sp.]